MKKMPKILFVGIMALCLLSGCYKQDETIKVKPSGKVAVEMTLTGNDEAVSQASDGATSDELIQRIIPQIESLKTDDSMTVEEVSEQVGEEEYHGIKVTAKYNDLNEMLASSFFNAASVQLMPTHVYDPAGLGGELDSGLIFKKTGSSMFGTTYTINGTISVADNLKVYQPMSDEEASQIAKTSQVNLTFKFPVIAWSNQRIIAPSATFSVNADNPNQEVHLWVFVPNYMLLLALLIIIGLLIAVIILASKLSKLSPKDDGPEFDSFATNFEEALSEDDENFFEGFDEEEPAEEETAEDTEETEDNE